MSRGVDVGWETLGVLRSYSYRLVNKPKCSKLPTTPPSAEENRLDNCLDLLEDGLRHALRRHDLDDLLDNGLDAKTSAIALAKVQALCEKLESVVNPSSIATEVEHAISQTIRGTYPNLARLINNLAVSSGKFTLVTHQDDNRSLFSPLDNLSAEALGEMVCQFNDFFTNLTSQTVRELQPQQESQIDHDNPDDDSRDGHMRISKGLTALLSTLRTHCEKSHKVLLQLPDWNSREQQDGSSLLRLELFLSDCQVLSWQEVRFDALTSM